MTFKLDYITGETGVPQVTSSGTPFSFDGNGLSNSPTADYPTATYLEVDFTYPVNNLSFKYDNYGSGNGSTYTVVSSTGTSTLSDDPNPDGFSDYGFQTFTVAANNVTKLLLSNGFTNPDNYRSWEFTLGSLSFTPPPPGPTAANGTITIGHDKTVDETAYLASLVTPGTAGDTETITAVTGSATLASGRVSYTAPSSGTDSFGFTDTDQNGNTASGTVAVTVDTGPVAGSFTTTAAPGHATDLTAAILAHVTPGIAGDTETIVAAGTAGTHGTVSLVNGKLAYTPAPSPRTWFRAPAPRC